MVRKHIVTIFSNVFGCVGRRSRWRRCHTFHSYLYFDFSTSTDTNIVWLRSWRRCQSTNTKHETGAKLLYEKRIVSHSRRENNRIFGTRTSGHPYQLYLPLQELCSSFRMMMMAIISFGIFPFRIVFRAGFNLLITYGISFVTFMQTENKIDKLTWDGRARVLPRRNFHSHIFFWTFFSIRNRNFNHPNSLTYDGGFGARNFPILIQVRATNVRHERVLIPTRKKKQNRWHWN